MYSFIISIIYFILSSVSMIIEWISIISAKLLCISLSIYLLYLLYKRLQQKIIISSQGKAVLITGCDSGFGFRLAQRLNKIGFRVYATVLDTDGTGAQQLTQSCVLNDSKLVVMKMDVTNDDEVRDVYKHVCNDLETDGLVLWAVVNNAGYGVCSLLEWGSMDEYRNIMDVNVFGVVRVTRIFLPLIRMSRGRIVNISSMFALVSLPRFGHYSMTKRAIVLFSDALRREMHRFGVRVSMIMPGPCGQTHLIGNAMKSLDRIWDETDDSVKAVYGMKSLKECKEYFSDMKFIVSDDIDLVVNDMMDAIVNSEPKIAYKPMELQITRIFFYIMTYMPTNWLDKVISIKK